MSNEQYVLAKHPHERIQTAADVEARITELLGGPS